MLELLLALAAGPAPQTAPAEPPASVQSGPLTVSQGGMMAWMYQGKLGGQVMILVDNAGPDADRVVSIRTPSGTVGDISVYPVVNGRGERAPAGDTGVRPGRTGVVGDLTDVASGQPMPVRTTVTVVFEHAGEVTVLAVPTSPAPAPPPPVAR